MIRHLLHRGAWVRLTPSRWNELISELGRRADGRRESGAFLLGPRAGSATTVTDVAYYDDLDPDSLTGGVTFGFEGFGPLWDLCDQREVRVIADVHTHGGKSVSQSNIDRANPMIARTGHIALIVPHLAGKPLRPVEVGIHRYLGDSGWETRIGAAAAKALYVGRWA